MCYYVILTGSVFVHFVPKREETSFKSAKDLFETLSQISLLGKKNTIAITEPTKEETRNVFLSYTEVPESDRLDLYELLISFMDIVDIGKECEVDAVLELAKLKSKTFDEVLIINGSNVYEEYKDLPENVLILDELDAQNHIKSNWNLV